MLRIKLYFIRTNSFLVCIKERRTLLLVNIAEIHFFNSVALFVNEPIRTRMKAVLEQLVLLISLCPELVDGAGVQVEKLLRKFVEPTVKWMRSLSFLTSGLGCGFFALFGAVFFFTGYAVFSSTIS